MRNPNHRNPTGRRHAHQRIGVLVAAGRGRRAGGTKQLLAWPTEEGNKPLVAVSFDAISGVCDEMIVVLGHAAGTVADALAPRPFTRVDADPDANMFESIRAGLVCAQELDSDASVLLQPGDHPQVAPATLTTLIKAADRAADCAVMPEFEGQGGHPVLIPPNLIARLIDADCPHGLRQFWIDHPELCVRLHVDDESVVRDVDRADPV